MKLRSANLKYEIFVPDIRMSQVAPNSFMAEYNCNNLLSCKCGEMPGEYYEKVTMVKIPYNNKVCIFFSSSFSSSIFGFDKWRTTYWSLYFLLTVPVSPAPGWCYWWSAVWRLNAFVYMCSFVYFGLTAKPFWWERFTLTSVSITITRYKWYTQFEFSSSPLTHIHS